MAPLGETSLREEASKYLRCFAKRNLAPLTRRRPWRDRSRATTLSRAQIPFLNGTVRHNGRCGSRRPIASISNFHGLRELIFNVRREIHARTFEETMRSMRTHIAIATGAARPIYRPSDRPCASVCFATSQNSSNPELGLGRPE